MDRSAFPRMNRLGLAVSAAFIVVFMLVAYVTFALPGAAPGEQSTGTWLHPAPPNWTPHPTSTDAGPLEEVTVPDIRRQLMFVSRVRVRHPEFEGLQVTDAGGNPDYRRAGGVDVTLHAAADLVDVSPRGRYFIGEVGQTESSDWRLSYEDMPLLVRSGDGSQVCIRPWNWFHQALSREAFLSAKPGTSDYHSYSFPPAWNKPLDATYYPGISGVSLMYSNENKPYAFGHERDEIFMKAGTEVLLRDLVAHQIDMPDPSNISSLCYGKDEWHQYADIPLYHDYLESSPGRYEWALEGLQFGWVHPAYDTHYVHYGEQPSGKVVVSPEMLYVDEWPEMVHPDMDDTELVHAFSVLDEQDDVTHRTFRNLPADAKGNVDDLYGDGKVEVIRSSVNASDVCREFSVRLNAVEYTPTYVAGGVEALCTGAGGNYNHMPMLMRDSRLVSMHPFVSKDDSSPDCSPIKQGIPSRECLDVNVGIEGRVVQRQEVFVYLYYRIYEQRYDASSEKWLDLNPNVDTLVVTNDPGYQSAAASFVNDKLRLAYEIPDVGAPATCDYRNPGHILVDARPEDKYVGSFKVDLPPAYTVTDLSARKKRFGVYLDVDMVHQVEIGGTGPGLDYRLDSGPFDTPGCRPSGTQVGSGLWNYSGRIVCPGGSANCAAWMGPPAQWKEFDIFRPTVTPVSTP